MLIKIAIVLNVIAMIGSAYTGKMIFVINHGVLCLVLVLLMLNE